MLNEGWDHGKNKSIFDVIFALFILTAWTQPNNNSDDTLDKEINQINKVYKKGIPIVKLSYETSHYSSDRSRILYKQQHEINFIFNEAKYWYINSLMIIIRN